MVEKTSALTYLKNNKSTAILFGRYDKIIIGILQLVMLALLVE